MSELGRYDPKRVNKLVGIITAEYAEQKQRIAELEAALQDAIDGYEEGTQYKGDYLFNKHGDAEEIARLRAVLEGGKQDG